MELKMVPKHYKIYPDVAIPNVYIVETYALGDAYEIQSWKCKYVNLEDISELIRDYEAREYIADYIQLN